MRTSSIFTVYGAAICFCVGSCSPKKPAPSTDELKWREIAGLIMSRTNLQPEEHVLLVSEPGRFDTLVTELEQAIGRTGAVYLGTVSVDTLNQPEGWTTDFVRGLKGKSLDDMTASFGEVDLGIMLPGASPSHKPYAALQEVLNLGRGRTIHFHWSGAYDLNGSPREVDSVTDRFYQRVLLETNYDSLAKTQVAFDSAMRKGDVRVTTPEGTNITFRIGNRSVTKQDGDASLLRAQNAKTLIDREIELPAGAIRVAPLEETVEGTIAFPNGSWNGQPVEGLVLTLKKGKVTDIKASKGQEHVKAELDQGGTAGYSFRELAVGFNPLLAIPSENPFIPYYGYGAGIVRLSLGDNSELGGNVRGPYVRWNFFTNATLTVGADMWIRDGVQVK